MTEAESGALIRVLRDHARITQTELAEALLRPPDQVAAIEAGTLSLRFADARRLARVFGLDDRRARAMVDASRSETRAAA